MCVLAYRNADRKKEFTTLDDVWCMRDTIGNGLPAEGLWHSVHRRRKLADHSQGASRAEEHDDRRLLTMQEA